MKHLISFCLILLCSFLVWFPIYIYDYTKNFNYLYLYIPLTLVVLVRTFNFLESIYGSKELETNNEDVE